MTIFVQVLKRVNGEYDRSTTIYDNADDAEFAYHTALASAIKKEEYCGVIAMLVNEKGEVIMRRVRDH